MPLINRFFGILLLTVCSAAAEPVPTWYWDCETPVANISTGQDTVGYGLFPAIRTDAESYSGDWSILFNDPWVKLEVDNYTHTDVWAPVERATVEIRFRFEGPFMGTNMLFMLHCKWKGTEWDTDDSWDLKHTAPNEFGLTMWHNGTRSTLTIKEVPVVAGTWHRIRCKYEMGRGMSFQFDDMPEKILNDPLAPLEAPHWYRLLWGNDRIADCNYYLDEFKVWDHWVEFDDSGAVTPVYIATSALPAAKESTAYSAPLNAYYGTGPYTWEAAGLPTGLSMNGNVIEGTTADTGAFTVTVTVTDADDSTAVKELELLVRPLHIVLPSGGARMEAEDMTLENYAVDSQADASEGACIKASGTGTARYQFSGTDGTYDLGVAYFDENDGRSDFVLYVNDMQVDAWTADEELGSASPVAATLTLRTVTGLSLAAGDVIKITGTEDSGEYGRIDYIMTAPSGVGSVRLPGVSAAGMPVPGKLFDQYGRSADRRTAQTGIYFMFNETGNRLVKVLVP